MKYEEVYLKAYAGRRETKAGIDDYFRFYNTSALSDGQSTERRRSAGRALVNLGNPAGFSLNFVPNLSN